MCSVRSNWKYVSTGSDSDSAPNRRQAIFWSNVGTLHWRIYASLGLNEKLDFNLYTCIFLHQNEYLCSLMIPCLQKILPRMFLSLDLLWEYRIQHGTNGPLYVTSSYSTWIFCRGVSGFATDCPCGVWCRGLTTFLLHVGPPFGNRILNNSWAVSLT